MPSCSRQWRSVHDYVVADQGTAQEALDKLVEDWLDLRDEGKTLTEPAAAPQPRRPPAPLLPAGPGSPV